MARKIEALFLEGPAGRLEALLEEPENEAPREAALVCHPHPKFGGTMHNKVVYRLARGLRHSGAVVLRFNYRGVNLSEGTYDEGIGETEDARSVLAFLRSRYGGIPFSLAGFSFGSRVILRLGCELAAGQHRPARLIAVGFPAGYRDSGSLGRCDLPRIFIQSTNDQYGPRPALQQYFNSLSGDKRLLWVEAKDHFFDGALEEFEKVVKGLGSASVQGCS